MLQLILIDALDPHGQISERSRSGVVKIELFTQLKLHLTKMSHSKWSALKNFS